MATTDIRASGLNSPIDVAEYLFRRLYEVGVRSVHGVPGDYNLEALDFIPRAGLKWVGNCNELNAGYAADGYARVNGISALVTTFGVGELSTLNAMAGAYSEYVPVVHIVGVPSTKSQRDGLLLHHTLGNGDFNVFAHMSSAISIVVAKLTEPYEIPSQIDNALRECYCRSRPVYITLPTDVVKQKIDGQRLKTPIDLRFPPNDPEKEDYVVDVVLKHLHAAKSPVILVDACAARHRCLDEVHAFMEKSGIPTFVAPMGKGSVDETHPNFGGVYAGEATVPHVRDRVESSDLVLMIGSIKSDFNTAGFSYRVSKLRTLEFHSTFIKVKYSEYPGLHMKGVLRKLIDKLDPRKISVVPSGAPKQELKKEEEMKEEEEKKSHEITHAWFWPRLGSWLKERDLVITETGTANFGIWNTRFPKGVTAISQILWGSIGYAVGATQGAAMAVSDASDNRRTILFVGDGSLQLTVQEISTMIRHNLNAIIFVICNEGYTIERFIHGMNASYNDIQPWNHLELPKLFGADPAKMNTYKVKTKQQMNELLQDKKFAEGKGLKIVEMHMPKKDAPKLLMMMTQSEDKDKETV